MQTTSNDSERVLTTPDAAALVRAGASVAAAGVLAPWLWSITARAAGRAAAGAPLRSDEALAALVASAALAGVGWLALSVSLELLALVPGAVGRAARRLADAITPTLLRRAAGALIGVGLVAGVAPGAAVARPPTVVLAPTPLPEPGFTPPPEPGWAPPRTVPADAGRGWVPSPPEVRAQPDVRVLSPSPRPGPGTQPPDEVVVRRGDSLWSVAARHLGPDASEAEIARAWPAWFEANRTVIGDDPDLLLPGQVLRPPEAVRS